MPIQRTSDYNVIHFPACLRSMNSPHRAFTFQIIDIGGRLWENQTTWLDSNCRSVRILFKKPLAGDPEIRTVAAGDSADLRIMVPRFIRSIRPSFWSRPISKSYRWRPPQFRLASSVAPFLALL